MLATAVCLLVGISWFFLPRGIAPAADDTATYDLQPIPIRTVGYFAGDRNRRTEFPVFAGSNASAASPGEMTTNDGTVVKVAADSLFGFSSETTGLLIRGEVFVTTLDSKNEYAVELGNVRVVGRNAKYRIQRSNDGSVVIEALAGDVELQTRPRLPRLYWSFDDVNEPAGLPLTLGTQSSRVAGLVGTGALRFVDQRGTCATIVGGIQELVGSGLFSMSGGMTIETVIKSTWDGAKNNQDVIYRKEDGPNRILLSLQNNLNEFAIPAVPQGPALSFGIFLRGLGYSELDMPLDGQLGRPTVAELADGQQHTIVATYSCFTGIKAIAVDGRICFSHQFPIGHCIQSGGPKPAMIGGWGKREIFGGIIDELAIYDDALTVTEIAQHHTLARQGKSWLPSQFAGQLPWKTIQTIVPGERLERTLSSFDRDTAVSK